MSSELSKEERVLRMVKRTLTDIAKDTVTPAGLKHPLSEQTIQGIRECLSLITAREAELQAESGNPATQRPHFVDEPSSTVTVSISAPRKKDGPEK